MTFRERLKHHVPYESSKTREFEAVSYEKVLSQDGIVLEVPRLSIVEHPCSGLDANDFRLDLVVAVAPETLRQVSFTVHNELNLMDALYNAKDIINEKLSK